MSVVDKLLLASLIIILPIGLISARFMMSEADEQELPEDAVTVEILEEMLSNQQVTEPLPTKAPIQVISAMHATDSGVLRVSGKAPKNSISVMVSATVLPAGSPTPAELGGSEDQVLGQEVRLVSVPVRDDGTFVFSSVIEGDGVAELRFEQDESSKTIRVDLATGRMME